MKVKCLGLKKSFYDRYNAEDLLKESGITPEQITDFICESLK
jgi:1-deoxy-D-xylulose-5-phosphate synthase